MNVTHQSCSLICMVVFCTMAGKHHIRILSLPVSFPSPLVLSQSECVTMPRCRHRGSCTTNIRNSVNFTLCCLPKNPGPRFGDLASCVSFQSLPMPAGSLFGCGSQKHLEVTSYGSFGTFKQVRTSSDVWQYAIQEIHKETNYKTWLQRKAV